jgi:hypothetical protein
LWKNFGYFCDLKKPVAQHEQSLSRQKIGPKFGHPGGKRKLFILLFVLFTCFDPLMQTALIVSL